MLWLALLPPTAAAEELPALDKWRFSHPIRALHVTSAQDLHSLFAAKDYELPALGAGESIPRIYLLRLVDDLHAIEPVSAREGLFIRIVLPLIARANAEVRAQRRFLESIIAARNGGQAISADRATWLAALAQLYRGTPNDLAGLRERVDEVPPSLAIAQAIDESGWGTAPLALRSNGLFGQHAPPGHGRGRLHVAGTNVDVAAFPSLLDGVLAYMTNINRHAAYAKLRRMRAQQRRENRRPDGYSLAAGLAAYSARGTDYVKTLRRLMREHKLHRYDTARLAPANGTTLIHANR